MATSFKYQKLKLLFAVWFCGIMWRHSDTSYLYQYSCCNHPEDGHTSGRNIWV